MRPNETTTTLNGNIDSSALEDNEIMYEDNSKYITSVWSFCGLLMWKMSSTLTIVNNTDVAVIIIQKMM